MKRAPNYAELQVTSNFSFLRGASHPDELMGQAFEHGCQELAITDRNTLAGIVRGHTVAKANDMRLIVGCRLDLVDGPSLLAYPTDKAAYQRLSALLTLGNLRAEKGRCELRRADAYAHAKGIKFIAVPSPVLNELFDLDPTFEPALAEYREAFGKHLYLAATNYYRGDDAKRLFRLSRLGNRFDVPLIATNDVLYHVLARRELQDVLTCVREKRTIHTAGFLINPNAEQHMKRPEEMARLFRDYPDAIRRTRHIADECRFSLDELKYEYPEELTTGGRTPLQELTHLSWRGAEGAYPDGIPSKIKATILRELDFIREMDYAPYFLTVYDIVRFARSRGILCQGRGSAANSAVCYCLGITSVDPTKFDLLFERFVSSARNEPPDIDVDFEHERREEVLQYIYTKYGRDRAAILSTVMESRQKGAIKDVGKAMGLSLDTVSRLSNSLWEFQQEWFEPERVREQGLDPDDPHLQKVLYLTWQMLGFPRQLGMHTGGFVIHRTKLSNLCPVAHAAMENRTIIEWNKDDADALGLLKIDVLGLGMLTCIRKCFELVKAHHGRELTLASVPQDDPAVYDMVSVADTIGVFQIESRAQQSMLPRMKPRCFYDLVIEVAVVRPGPILGDMVHPYLRRRNGQEPVEKLSKELEGILGRTLGIPLFQEQMMRIAIEAAGFTPAEADQLRRSMATFKTKGGLEKFEQKLIDGMTARGYTREYAQDMFEKLKGFSGYGFPESHAASFAALVYVSAWLKCYYPAAFTCALLNSYPMGFYAPAQLVSDAKAHVIEVRPVDANRSGWDCALEPDGDGFAVRLGFRSVKTLRESDMAILTARRVAPYADITALWHAGVPQPALETLANANAFRSIGLDRRQAMWAVSGLADRPAALFAEQQDEAIEEVPVTLPVMTPGENVLLDYTTTSLSLEGHPVSFVRDRLRQLKIVSSVELGQVRHAQTVKVAGLMLLRQRPGTAQGVCFMTLEDEMGTINLVVFKHLFDKFRKEILHSKVLMAEGMVQREGIVTHVVVRRLTNLSSWLRVMADDGGETLPLLIPSADEVKHGLKGSDKTQRAIPSARNFR